MCSLVTWLFLAIEVMLVSRACASYGAEEFEVKKTNSTDYNVMDVDYDGDESLSGEEKDNSIIVREFPQSSADVMHFAFLVGCKLGFKSPLNDIKSVRRLENVDKNNLHLQGAIVIRMKDKEKMMKWVETYRDKRLWTEMWHLDEYEKPTTTTKRMSDKGKEMKGYNVVVNLYPQNFVKEDIMRVVSRIGILMGIKSPLADVKDAYRLQLGNGDKCRPIVIRLKNKAARAKWSKAYNRDKLRKKNQTFVLDEHLIKNTNNLLRDIKKWVLMNDFEAVWSHGPKVFVRKTEDSVVVPLHSLYGYVLDKSPFLRALAQPIDPSSTAMTTVKMSDEQIVEGDDEEDSGSAALVIPPWDPRWKDIK
uniref:Uncharacterized protein n=1 Tax=Cacopsylla melanoneura TaxID=428564 RepID=A0A8D9F0W1_9HEMI